VFCASFQGTFKKIWCALTSRWNLFLFFSFPCPFSPFSTSFFWAICLHKLSFHGDLEFFSLNFFLPIFILKLLEVLACFLFFCLCSLVACNFFKNVKVNLSTLVFALSLTIVSRALRLTSSVVTFQSLVVLSRVSKPIAKFHLNACNTQCCNLFLQLEVVDEKWIFVYTHHVQLIYKSPQNLVFPFL
jgi:hypothetical protein